jgi:hypothetical protein
VLYSMLLFIYYVKTFAKVAQQKGFDKKQFIKKVLEKKKKNTLQILMPLSSIIVINSQTSQLKRKTIFCLSFY